MEANQITGLRRFLERWDATPEENPAHLPLNQGKHGNVNLDGRNGSLAATFTRHHPQFFDSLEEGVRELVLCLVDKFNCITYSSCAGHEGENGEILRERNVDIAPRDESEYRVLKELFSTVISNLNVSSDHVDVRLNETVLESDEMELNCLDIQFAPKTADGRGYFSDLDFVYRQFLAELVGSALRYRR